MKMEIAMRMDSDMLFGKPLAKDGSRRLARRWAREYAQAKRAARRVDNEGIRAETRAWNEYCPCDAILLDPDLDEYEVEDLGVEFWEEVA